MKRRQLLKQSATTLVGFSSLPAISVLLKSCGVNRPSDYEPTYLTTEQFDTVWQIAELILPKTDSPGASDAGVAPYIDLLYQSFFEDEEKEKMESGLASFMTNCQQVFNKPFLELEKQVQIKHLTDLDTTGKSQSFFKSMKRLVLWAYFTSEVGMKSLNYQPVPGRYDGCITIDSNEKLLAGNR